MNTYKPCRQSWRYFSTLKYLSAVQILYLVKSRIRRRELKKNAGICYLKQFPGKIVKPISVIGIAYFSEDSVEFSFLNETRNFKNLSWSGPESLWYYHLNYFDYVKRTFDSAPLRANIAMIYDWIDNSDINDVGFDPYPTSRRIVNWIFFLKLNDIQDPKIIDSLVKQAYVLQRNIEWHIPGNHIFANAKALIFVGLCLDGVDSARWFAVGMDILQNCLQSQFLKSGCYFELSPSYHSVILEDLLDLANIFFAASVDTHPQIRDRIHQLIPLMFGWLTTIVHPDGHVPFFNDSNIGNSVQLEDLRAYANRLEPLYSQGFIRKPSAASSETLRGSCLDGSFSVLRGRDVHLVAKVGNIGPDEIPGHSHADSLSFECSFFGKRVIVNRGISTYEVGRTRSIERATRSHSTVEIDGLSSSDVWASFRVGRRARSSCHRLASENSVGYLAQHDGYSMLWRRRLHQRQVELYKNSLIIEDSIKGSFVKAKVIYHFHPDIVIRRTADICHWEAVHSETGRIVRIQILSGACQVKSGWYSPEFGKRMRAASLVITFESVSVKVIFEW